MRLKSVAVNIACLEKRGGYCKPHYRLHVVTRYPQINLNVGRGAAAAVEETRQESGVRPSPMFAVFIYLSLDAGRRPSADNKKISLSPSFLPFLFLLQVGSLSLSPSLNLSLPLLRQEQRRPCQPTLVLLVQTLPRPIWSRRRRRPFPPPPPLRVTKGKPKPCRREGRKGQRGKEEL